MNEYLFKTKCSLSALGPHIYHMFERVLFNHTALCTGTCEHQFPLKTLQDILPANLFSLALRKMQEEELRQAAIPDLVSCPFCSFATIMPDTVDKVFKCLNPDCLRDSCRQV